MLKTYRIIPLVFILFLFGFTLITVAPVFAEDSPEFVACQQIKPQGDFQLMKQKKNCFRDVARALQDQLANKPMEEPPTLTPVPSNGPTPNPSDATPAAVADGPWDKSMGLRHPDRPCMDRSRVPGGCGPDMRSQEQIASDPYDTKGTSNDTKLTNGACTYSNRTYEQQVECLAQTMQLARDRRNAHQCDCSKRVGLHTPTPCSGYDDRIRRERASTPDTKACENVVRRVETLTPNNEPHLRAGFYAQCMEGRLLRGQLSAVDEERWKHSGGRACTKQTQESLDW